MQIRVYPSTMPGEPIETHEWSGTLGAWFDSVGIDYRSWDKQPIAASKGGVLTPASEWDVTLVDADVDLRVLPHGPTLLIGAVVAAISIGAALLLMPNPGIRNRNENQQGTRLDTASATANQAKFGDVVPELAGRFRRYPDYLTPPRRHFLNGMRAQWVEFHACVGPGHYQIDDDDVRVGDTQVAGLGADASLTIYEPGADLAAVGSAEHWHTVSEVGGTSTGTAGLELSVDMQTAVHAPAPAYEFSGTTITIPSEHEQTFPIGWGPSTEVTITIDRPLTYTVSLVAGRNRFAGNFGHILPLPNGTEVEVSGAGLTGPYLVYGVSLDGDGDGYVELWTLPVPATEDDPAVDPQPINDISDGDYTITFTKPLTILLSSSGPDFIELYGHSYPEFEAAATIVYSGGAVYGAFTSQFGATPSNEVTSTLEIDFFFPNGLTQILSDGSLGSRVVNIELQYRDVDLGGAWTSVRYNYTQATLDQIGFTERLTIDPMRPEVRVRRVSPTSTSTQIQDKVHWYGLKSRLPTRTSYPNWTTMGVKIRSGGKLGAQSENQINVIATRKLPTLQPDGSWGAAIATRDISAFARYIAQSIGYTDANIDMDELERLHDIWSGRDETLDFVFEGATVKDALDTAFGAGMSELTIDEGLIKPVRDDVRTQFEQGYSPQNMTGPLKRVFRSRRIDDHDGVEVEYIDGETWTKEVVQCQLPGDDGFKVQKIKLDGVTDKTRAWRIGMRQRRMQRYRNWEYGFETELDALNSSYLSYVPLVDDIPGYGQSAILESIEPALGEALLRVSEPLDWIDGEPHVVAYRKPDGTIAGPFAATQGDDDYSLVADIPTPWPVVTLSHEPPHIYFGTAPRWTFPALITDIAPSGLERVSVTATNYDVRVYADDNNSPSQDD